MTIRLALRSLLARPVRSAVLACGFGFGVAVMAALLGVGDVILEQSRAPSLWGGGDLLVSGSAGRVPSPRFVLGSVLAHEPLAGRVAAASPSASGTLYLVEPGRLTGVRVRAGIPSLERAIGDPETSQVPAWVDPPGALRWTRPDPSGVLRSIDRFHAIPDAQLWKHSWAEWLYFNGRTRDGHARFYLTFLVGPQTPAGLRAAGVRLQLEQEGVVRNYSRWDEVLEDEVLASAPDLDIAQNQVRLVGLDYRITLRLDPESGSAGSANGAAPLSGELVLSAVPGRSIPPIALRGGSGWVSGYVVPVLEGALSGTLRAGGRAISFENASGYHDHNWGFWEGVTWQWGQVAGGDLSIVYGRVKPPPEAADPDRVPGFLAVLGAEGPLGYTSGISIEESGEGPSSLTVEASEPGFEVRLDATVRSVVRSPLGGPFGAREASARAFLQMRADFKVRGTVRGRSFAFDAPGSAETFRAW